MAVSSSSPRLCILHVSTRQFVELAADWLRAAEQPHPRQARRGQVAAQHFAGPRHEGRGFGGVHALAVHGPQVHLGKTRAEGTQPVFEQCRSPPRLTYTRRETSGHAEGLVFVCIPHASHCMYDRWQCFCRVAAPCRPSRPRWRGGWRRGTCRAPTRRPGARPHPWPWPGCRPTAWQARAKGEKS